MTREQEELVQLETYAADLSRTYSELRRHLHHLTVLHEVNTRIASALDPDEVRAHVADDDVKQTVKDATDAAIELGVFGVPTVQVGDELFWGDDRLEEAAATLA